MKNISYHTVKETDTKRILELYRKAGWWEEGNDARHIETVANIIKHTFCFVVAKKGDKIVGMGRAISDGFSDAYIQDVTVDEDYRGEGIGKGIIQHLLKHLKDSNIQWIGLISEPGYDGFYKGLGLSVMKGYTPFLLNVI